MDNTLVSILVPFKDTAKYLPECISSIKEQTYSNWEIIAVNDHSTDDSLMMVKEFAKSDSRIKVFQNTGNGVIEALRKAYAVCRGIFITRMDSDDIMTPDRLEIMVKLLQNYGPGHVSVGQVKYFSDRGISDGYDRYEKWLNKLTASGKNYSEIYKECVIPSPCWMVYRENFEMAGGFESNRYPEDYDLTFRFYENKLKVIPCDQLLLYWRDYDTRTSRTSEHYAQNYFLNIKLDYFLKLDYNPKRRLIIWGAGYKGKKIAKSLLQKEIGFYWICNNPRKIGKKIYGQKLLPLNTLDKMLDSQSIITVANENAQEEIRTYFMETNRKSMVDYFFFC